MLDRDIAYAFGTYPMPKKGQKVFPGEIMCTTPKGTEPPTSHPCPMRYVHAEGLIRGYTRAVDQILDPCAGSGTIVDAAVRNRRRVTAIEIERKYCDEIVERVRIASAQQTLSLEVG